MSDADSYEEMKLSASAVALWAKTKQDTEDYLPLYIHMIDSYSTVGFLWDTWVAESTKSSIRNQINGNPTCDEVKNLVQFLAMSHDIGKACPAFQAKKDIIIHDSVVRRLDRLGLKIPRMSDPNAIGHATVSQMILERNGVGRDISLIVGGHHGSVPSNGDLRHASAYPNNTGFSDSSWKDVQDELFHFICRYASVSSSMLSEFDVGVGAQVLISGIVSMSDWIASNDGLFPIKSDGFDTYSLKKRSQDAFGNLHLPRRWVFHENAVHPTFEERFGFKPRPFQSKVMQIAEGMQCPGLMIIEAPTGEGKTEAALSAAEIMARRFGSSGLIIALPTQATADGVFPRIKDWIESVSAGSAESHTVFLAHGKSRFNVDYNSLPHIGFDHGSQKSGAVLHDWFTGKRKGLLSDFVIGTVDQVLMAGLKQRYLPLRHLALSGKVVIIDECHAYDAYMGSYLFKVVEWLGLYGIPTILMSATLPFDRKQALVDSYLKGTGIGHGYADDSEISSDYPLLTYTGPDVCEAGAEKSERHLDVLMRWIHQFDFIDVFRGIMSDGGTAGIIVNTVHRSQQLYDELRTAFPNLDLRLLHSAFIAVDRSSNESDVIDLLGKDRVSVKTLAVVGTQVMEQSLDLDFDVLFTDLCPVDLLMQRIGRLHRHENNRPEKLRKPICFIMDPHSGDFDSGSEYVYGKYHLLNTRRLINDAVSIPEDIPRLIQAAYVPGSTVSCPIDDEIYRDAWNDDHLRILEKERKAKSFQIRSPTRMHDISGWVDSSIKDDPDGIRALATVRDTEGSVEVLLIYRSLDGILCMLPWIAGGQRIPDIPEESMAFNLSGCKIPLPSRIVSVKGVENLIDMIRCQNSKDIPESWHNTDWLRDELFLILDENLSASVCGFKVCYDKETGLILVD